jgi:hypothetical protein
VKREAGYASRDTRYELFYLLGRTARKVEVVMDIVSKSTKWMDHNRGTFVAFVVMIVMVGGILFVGCKSTAPGLVPGVKVDRTELKQQLINAEAGFAAREAEVAAIIGKINADKLAAKQIVDAAVIELDRQDMVTAKFIETVGTVGIGLAEGTMNPMSLIFPAIGLAGAVYGGGKSYDNKNKDRVIAEKKAKTA